MSGDGANRVPTAPICPQDFRTPIGTRVSPDKPIGTAVTMKHTAGWPSWTERKLTMDPGQLDPDQSMSLQRNVLSIWEQT
jgi:hypothetical protein